MGQQAAGGSYFALRIEGLCLEDGENLLASSIPPPLPEGIALRSFEKSAYLNACTWSGNVSAFSTCKSCVFDVSNRLCVCIC